MVTMRLDRDGNAPIPEGYILVTSEVEFLKLATENRPLHIRGDRLCNWAESFLTGREIPFKETSSYTRELHNLLPALNSVQIAALIAFLGTKLETLERPLRFDTLLITAAPHHMWHETPSLKHLVEWLLWLDETDNIETIAPLFDPLILRWQMEDLPFDAQFYSIRTKEAAQEALKSWLGLTDRDLFPMRQEFPLEVPLHYQNTARQIWREEIIQSRGTKFEQLSRQKLPFSLLKIAAEETYEYYLHNQNDLDVIRLESLASYLNTKKISALRKILPPVPPSELPADPIGIVMWFIREYLPYREWQRSSGSEEGQMVALHAARQFEMWYLTNYPKGLNGSALHRWLSFNKVNQVNCPETCLTLLIILDGMHVSDSRILLQSVLSQTQRLAVTSHDYVFAPIPTVTQFAKEALMKGVPPARVDDIGPIGRILPERQSPALRLRDAETGKLYIWRVLEPDNTYHHKNTSENLLQDVEGRLEAEALKIKEIVESIPDNVILQMILTTDHGRLLSETQKTIQVPTNMESHGRAAWGKSPFPFENDPYFIQDDIAYLSGDSYGMLSDIALPLAEESFKDNNNRAGSELFPHGGIFPEEVILPWIVLARDLVQPEATVIIKGTGRARREGNFNVVVVNKSDVELTLENLTLTLRTGTIITLKPNNSIPARSQASINILFTPWPSAGDVDKVNAIATLRLPNQMVFEYPAEVTVSSEDIYVRPKDKILEDLE